jgi:hypothetical protein
MLRNAIIKASIVYIGEVCTRKRQRYRDVKLTSLLALATLGDTTQTEMILSVSILMDRLHWRHLLAKPLATVTVDVT